VLQDVPKRELPDEAVLRAAMALQVERQQPGLWLTAGTWDECLAQMDAPQVKLQLVPLALQVELELGS
jgi:hypothetical protein